MAEMAVTVTGYPYYENLNDLERDSLYTRAFTSGQHWGQISQTSREEGWRIVEDYMVNDHIRQPKLVTSGGVWMLIYPDGSRHEWEQELEDFADLAVIQSKRLALLAQFARQAIA